MLAAVGSRPKSVYQKSIPSDLTDKAGLRMLISLHENHHAEGWSSFKLPELPLLARAFTILKFNPNFRIMKAGEISTFFCIILSGTCNVHIKSKIERIDESDIPAESVVPVRTGSILGEMAFFGAEAKRSADVYTGGSHVVLALMTYQELRQLHLIDPEMQVKLLCLLGSLALKKQQSNLVRSLGGDPRVFDKVTVTAEYKASPSTESLMNDLQTRQPPIRSDDDDHTEPHPHSEKYVALMAKSTEINISSSADNAPDPDAEDHLRRENTHRAVKQALNLEIMSLKTTVVELRNQVKQN
jgi:hypothetical protein